MSLSFCFSDFKKGSAILLFFVILLGVSVPVSDAVTTFSTNLTTKEMPAPFDFDDIWFYNADMLRVIPDIDMGWVTVVLHAGLVAPDGSDSRTESETLFVQRAKEIVRSYDEIIDFFYDRNLAKDACFFRLRKGLKENALKNLIVDANRNQFVAYVHPTIRLKGKTHAFFDAFEMQWKTGVEDDLKERIMNKAHVSWDKSESTYRVKVSQAPFFKAINLLAEDIHVLKATPYLVELKPSITAELTLPIYGADIGDKIPFSLNVVFSDLVTIDPSSIANIGLKPAEIQKELFELKFDPYDYVQAASKSPINITGWMKFYTPGEFLIPPVKIQYTSATSFGKRVRSVETKGQPFKVSSMVPSKTAEKKLVVPTDHLDPDYKIEPYQQKARTSLLLSLSSFLIALFCVAWLIRKIYEVKKETERLKAIKHEDVLADKLKTFLMEQPSGSHSIYVGEASKLLRAYLVAKYQITPYPSGGSGKVFFESIKNELPAALAPKVGSLLKAMDDIVALELNSVPDIESLRSEVRQIIEAA